MAAPPSSARLTNWSGNQAFAPLRVARPASVDELRSLVAGAPRVKVLGSAHSFSAVAGVDAGTTLVQLGALEQAPPRLVVGPSGAATIDVPAGWTYAALAAHLAGTRWALANMASLPHISVGGSVATATHGSGARNANLAGAVVALELVAADGRLLAVDARTPRWPAHVVHLGALGVVTRVTLALVPAFALRQDVFEGLPWDVGVGHLRALLAGGYSVSLFTTWAAPLQFQVWRKSLVANGGDGGGGGSGGGGGGASGAQSDDGVTAVAPDDAAAARGGAGAPSSGAPDADAWFGAPRATEDRHPIPGVDAAPCTRQCGEPGPWHARLPHFRAEFTPSVGAELQSEYFVGTADAPAALCALAPLAPRIAELLFITELRAVAADDLPLSTARGRDSVALHFTWRPLEAAVRALLPALEAALAPFAARPHWGKLFAADAAVLSAAHGGAARLDGWRALRAELDPTAKFGNEFLRDAGLLDVPAGGEGGI
jgi:xylitol oxidase